MKLKLKIQKNKTKFKIFLVILLLLGFFISIFLRSPIIVYLVTIIAGIISGKIIFERRIKDPLIPAIFILVVFLAGFIVGSFSAPRIITLLLFIAAMLVTYILYNKKIVGTFKRKDFMR